MPELLQVFPSGCGGFTSASNAEGRTHRGGQERQTSGCDLRCARVTGNTEVGPVRTHTRIYFRLADHPGTRLSLWAGRRSLKVTVNERSRFSRCTAFNLDFFPVRPIDEVIPIQWDQR